MHRVRSDLTLQNNTMIMLVLRLTVFLYGLGGSVLRAYKNHYYIDWLPLNQNIFLINKNQVIVCLRLPIYPETIMS